MKAKTHPKYYAQAKVTCSCGSSFVTGSTQEEIHVEICSACHPLYTGKKKLIDTTGQVDKFKARVGKKSTDPLRNRQSKREALKAKKIANKIEK